MTKRGIILSILCIAALLIPAAAFAQGLEGTDAEFRLFGVELGSLVGYNLEDEEAVVGRSFGLSLAVLDNMQVGFGAVVFDAAAPVPQRRFAGMKFDYFFTDQLAFSLLAGNAAGGGAAYGGAIGGQYLIVRNQPQDGFSSALKLKVDYFINDEDGPAGGTLAIGLAGSIGL
ncbi:MAG: hypothetical protein EA384_11630 [Spirochaetaceae bacterium]|nr:MAG: hypothetical protein EA384_11630 [Spirochaetaceae bacterium]